MKRLIKGLCKIVWKMIGPVRRPLMRRTIRLLNNSLLEIIQKMESTPGWALSDCDLALNSVVRELARLQVRIEVLQQLIQHMAHANHAQDLSVTGEAAPAWPVEEQRKLSA